MSPVPETPAGWAPQPWALPEPAPLHTGPHSLDGLGYQYLPGVLRGHALEALRQAFCEVVSAGVPSGEGDPLWLTAQQRLLADPRVLAPAHPLAAVVAQWVGPVTPHCGDICRIAAPGYRTLPHQDAAYSGRLDALTAWVAVEDVPLHRGPLVLCAGSHRAGVLPHGLGAAGLLSPPPGCWHGGALAAGDVILFSATTAHASLPNLSDAPRLSVDYRFWPV